MAKSEFTTIKENGLVGKIELDIEYTYHEAISGSHDEPGEPEHVEIENISYKGVQIDEIISLLDVEYYHKLASKILEKR